MDDTVVTPRKLRLRRINPGTQSVTSSVDDEIIQKNLEPLREHVEKKKRAQDAYYESHFDDVVGISPLIRNSRRPVKQRLGRTNIPYAGTSTSFLPPKQRLRKVNTTLNNKITQRKSRTNIAQQRLQRIRAQNQQSIVNNSVRKIKIRRHEPTISDHPKTLVVKFNNNNANFTRYNNQYMNNRMNNRNRRFKMILNRRIQMEIKQLQAAFTGNHEVAPTKIVPAYTEQSMSERFASLH